MYGTLYATRLFSVQSVKINEFTVSIVNFSQGADKKRRGFPLPSDSAFFGFFFFLAFLHGYMIHVVGNCVVACMFVHSSYQAVFGQQPMVTYVLHSLYATKLFTEIS